MDINVPRVISPPRNILSVAQNVISVPRVVSPPRNTSSGTQNVINVPRVISPPRNISSPRLTTQNVISVPRVVSPPKQQYQPQNTLPTNTLSPRQNIAQLSPRQNTAQLSPRQNTAQLSPRQNTMNIPPIFTNLVNPVMLPQSPQRIAIGGSELGGPVIPSEAPSLIPMPRLVPISEQSNVNPNPEKISVPQIASPDKLSSGTAVVPTLQNTSDTISESSTYTNKPVPFFFRNQTV